VFRASGDEPSVFDPLYICSGRHLMACWLHSGCAQGMNLGIDFFFLVGRDRVHLVRRPLFDLLYQPQMMDDDGCNAKPKYSEKTCPNATLSTTNPTWPDPRAAAVISRRLTAWAMARPGIDSCNCESYVFPSSF
jgi:hypothetical protein